MARLRLPGWDEPKTDVLGIVHGWLSDETNSQWRMVVDNADDAAVMFDPWNGKVGTTTAAASTPQSLSDYLPLSSHGSIVITSRSREVVSRLQVFYEDVLDVKPMEVDVAVTLLLKKLKKAGPQASPDEMARLVKHLDCLPLAVTQAAAYIEQAAPRMTVTTYMGILEKNNSELATLLQKDIRDPRRDRHASNSIITTWHVTFTYLRQTRNSAARLLALMSLFSREMIPDNLLQGQYSDATDGQTDFEDDIVTLKAYSLIGVIMSDNFFEMHRLVQLSTQKWLEIHEELQGWRNRYVDILGVAFPTGDYANWTTCQPLFPHIEAMESNEVTDIDHVQVWARVLYNGAWYAMARGKYGIADRMARASLEPRGEIHGFANAVTLDSTDMLAEVLRFQGKYEQAEEMNQRALAGREKVLGVDHPDTLTSVSNLASVLQDQGKYEQAEEMNQRALAGREKVLGVDHPSTLTSVYCLAYLLSATHKHHEALDLYQRATAGYIKLLGPEHQTTVACQRDRASLVEKINRRFQ